MGYGQYSGRQFSNSGGENAFSNATGARVRAVLKGESEVAHVWASESQSHGRYRSIYFHGATLYSYGSHYIISRIMSDGIVLLNSDRNSVTTNGHRQSAAYAVSHKRTLGVPDLTKALRILDDMESSRKAIKAERGNGVDFDNPDSYGARVVRALKSEKEAGRRYVFNEAHAFSDESAVYMLKRFGYPAATWPAIKAERAKADAKEKADSVALAYRRALADAKSFTALSDSAFAATWPLDAGAHDGRTYRDGGASYQEAFKKRLVAAHKASKAAGYTTRTVTLWRRLKAFREYMAGRESRLHAAAVQQLRDDFAAWQAGGDKPPYAWRYDNAGLLSEAAALRAADDAEREAIALAEYDSWRSTPTAVRRPDSSRYPEGSIPRNVLEPLERADMESAVAALELWRTRDSRLMPTATPESNLFGSDFATRWPDIAERIGGDPWRELVFGWSKAEAEADKAAKAEAERLRKATEAEQAAAWIAGNAAMNGYRLSDPEGGALLRIVGDPAEPDSAELETSHGARVPLSHAIKAFRFVKLVRARGEAWQRNGKQVRVGHYQLDRIDAAGFDAGCHRINWPEIERVAILAGVFDCPADDAAVTEKGVA